MINTETNYRWFIFYQDQLLLEKNDNAFSIPTARMPLSPLRKE